jgi:hypothetical protein
MERDIDYYRRRLAQELTAAEDADSGIAEQRHRDLAHLYGEKLDSLGDSAAGARELRHAA